MCWEYFKFDLSLIIIVWLVYGMICCVKYILVLLNRH